MMQANRRQAIEILAEIFKLGTFTRTKLMYQVNMSHIQSGQYLNFLLDRGFVETDGKAKIYRVTGKGQHLYRAINEVLRLVGVEV